MTVLPEGWLETTLDEVSTIKGGKRLPKGKVLVNYRTKHPYIRITDLENNAINKGQLQFVTDDVFSNISRYIVNSGDVIVSIVGTIGLVAKIDDDLDTASLTENCVKLINLENLTADYLYYYLISRVGQYEVNKNTVGAVQKKLPIYGVQNIQINLPPLPEQKAIADMLSSFDEKIELLREQNKTLETLAQTIFKEWFVNFNYPDATGEMVDSELGEIPKGWRVIKLEEVTTEIRRGISPKYTETNGVKVVNQRCIRKHSIDFNLARLNDPEKKKVDDRYIKLGDVLVNSTGVGTLGRLAPVRYLPEAIVFDSHVTVVRADSNMISKAFLCGLMVEKEVFIERSGSGTTGQTELRKQTLEEIQFAMPPIDLGKQFERLVEPINKKIAASEVQQKDLSETRDILLPKLMSGQVRVQGE